MNGGLGRLRLVQVIAQHSKHGYNCSTGCRAYKVKNTIIYQETIITIGKIKQSNYNIPSSTNIPSPAPKSPNQKILPINTYYTRYFKVYVVVLLDQQLQSPLATPTTLTYFTQKDPAALQAAQQTYYIQHNYKYTII